MSSVAVAYLSTDGEVAILFIPLRCYEELINELVPDQILDAVLRDVKVIATIDSDPMLSGAIYHNVGPYGIGYTLIEVTYGLYLPVNGVVPTQCLFANGEFLWCRYGLQRVLLRSDCRRCILSQDIGIEKLVELCRSLVSNLSLSTDEKCVTAFAKVDKHIILWEVMREPLKQ